MHFMRGKIYMRQEKIRVLLKEYKNHDCLVFEMDPDDRSKDLPINFNSESCQLEIKTVFSVLLEKMVDVSIQLEFQKEPQYSKVLYIDVCKEYIADLNREIGQIQVELSKELSR